MVHHIASFKWHSRPLHVVYARELCSSTGFNRIVLCADEGGPAMTAGHPEDKRYARLPTRYRAGKLKEAVAPNIMPNLGGKSTDLIMPRFVPTVASATKPQYRNYLIKCNETMATTGLQVSTVVCWHRVAVLVACMRRHDGFSRDGPWMTRARSAFMHAR